MLHALYLTRSFQAAKTPWQAVSKNDNEAIECAPHGFAKAAFQDILAALPIVTYEAGETVDGSSTGTRVPRMWVPFEPPTIRRSYLCSRFRQSVSISPSRFFKCTMLMQPAK